MKSRDKESKRSKRRESRGFRSVETSSRKHRRAIGRSERAVNGYTNLLTATDTKFQKGVHKPGKVDYH